MIVRETRCFTLLNNILAGTQTNVCENVTKILAGTLTDQELGLLLGTLRCTNQDAEDVFELYYIEYNRRMANLNKKIIFC